MGKQNSNSQPKQFQLDSDKPKPKKMWQTVSYLLSYLILIVALMLAYLQECEQLVFLKNIETLFISVFVGGIGGVTYCLRGVYLNYCVKDQWDEKWFVWYLLRPWVSLVCGGISWLFLKTGLLVLGAGKSTSSSELGFYALAFIAGFNVDKFLLKMEDIAQTVWGIQKSRATKEETKKTSEKS